jgi:hypothetical protein
MTRRIEVSITIGDRRVTLEGPEDFVRTEVERLARGDVSDRPAARSGEHGDAGRETTGGGPPVSEHQLMTEKKPRNHVETVAVLAYCLTKNGQLEFTPEDVRRAYLRAQVRPPKIVSQALRDAKNNADYIEPGKRRGTFRLSAHGERTVLFDLPRTEQKSK